MTGSSENESDYVGSEFETSAPHQTQTGTPSTVNPPSHFLGMRSKPTVKKPYTKGLAVWGNAEGVTGRSWDVSRLGSEGRSKGMGRQNG